MVVFHSYVNVYQRVIFPVLGIPWYTHFKDSYCGMTMAHMLPSQPAHLRNIYEWMALSETGIPRSLLMNHHFPIMFPSFSHHFPIIFASFSHHFPSEHGHVCGSTPSFFFRIPVVPVVPWSLGELGPAVSGPARHLDLRYCGLQGEAQSAHIASILQAIAVTTCGWAANKNLMIWWNSYIADRTW